MSNYGKTFTVASPARLDLSNIRGSWKSIPARRISSAFKSRKDANSGDAKRTENRTLPRQPMANRQGRYAFPEGAWTGCSVPFPAVSDYVVQTPRKCFIKVNGVSSEALAEGFEGEFSFHSSAVR